MIRTKLIGVSGCTNGGKTTLSKRLLAAFPSSYYLSQDDFYHKRDANHYEYIPELNSFNFDVISAIDMPKFHRKLRKIIKSNKYEYIFIDGILIFEDDKLLKMLDRKYFLDLDKEECHRRRLSRQYILEDTANYFDMCVWKEFTKYKFKCTTSIKNIIYINATQNKESIFLFVANDLIK